MAANNEFDKIKALQDLNKLIEAEKNSLTNIEDINKRIDYQNEINKNNQKIIADSLELQKQAKEGTADLDKEQLKVLDNILNSQKRINVELTKEQKLRRDIVNVATDLAGQFKKGFDWLMQQDKIIRSTILNLGMSGTKAELMRVSFEESLGFVAQMGGNLEDVQKIMEGFAEETGKARALSVKMVTDIEAIGKGTGLGVEQATKLGAQFEFMGLDAKSTNTFVQGIVDTTERMGINTTKVLKNVNDNFKKLNTYNFQSGSKGMAQLAMNAEKTRVSIEDTLTVMEKGRTLEGAIDIMSQLQVMGGEFAKSDPLQFMHDIRNEPEKINEQISQMTKGLVGLKKQGDGTFERILSPADRDRIIGVGKALGLTADQITIIAQKRFDMDKMARQLEGKGLTGREKELIEGVAVFNNATTKYEVTLAGHLRDISTLTATEAQSFAKQTVSLEQRSKNAMTLEEAFKAAVLQLKAGLLPLLNSINGMLTKYGPIVSGWITKLTAGSHGWLKAGIVLVGAATGLKLAGMAVNAGIQRWVMSGLLKKVAAGTVTSAAKDISGGMPPVGGVAKGAAGMGMLRGGAGIGVAAAGLGAMGVGIGEGINLAATGISKLADSMSKLTPEQAASLKSIAMTLAISFPLAAVGIAAVGLAGEVGALGILAVGAAMVGIGFGISLATKGIGTMAEGLADLNKSGSGAGKQMLGVAAGVGAITLAMGAGGVVSLFAFNNSLSRMADKSADLQKIGIAFANIQTVLSGSKEDFIAVENAVASIANTNIKGGSAFAQLAALLKTPLKVEFADKKVQFVSDITLEIDGQRFMQKMFKPEVMATLTQAKRTGKS